MKPAIILANILVLMLPIFSQAENQFDIGLLMKSLGRPIFAGYGDVNSDVNRTHVADKVCQYFGFGSAGDYQNRWSIEDKGELAFIIEEKGKLIVKVGLPEVGRTAARYTNMKCLK